MRAGGGGGGGVGNELNHLLAFAAAWVHVIDTLPDSELHVHIVRTWPLGQRLTPALKSQYHNDVIKRKHFPRYWLFVRGIHRWPVNSPHKGQWRGALIVSLICAWTNGWVNNRDAGDLRRHRAHYGVTVMLQMVKICMKTGSFTTIRCYFGGTPNGVTEWMIWFLPCGWTRSRPMRDGVT